MKTFAAVFQRELFQRRQVLLLSAVASVTPFLLRYAPNVAASDRTWVTTIFGLILLFAFALGLPLTLGTSMIGRDLTEKRLGFYFSRPLSIPAFFSGKLVGNLLITAASAAIILLPLLLFEPRVLEQLRDHDFRVAIIVLIVAPVLCLLVANTVSLMVRSRSKLLAVDLICLMLAGFAVYSLIRQFLFRGALGGIVIVAVTFLSALAAALAAASLAHLAQGRTDAKRGHAALSVTFWSMVALSLIALFGFAWWYFSPAPRDLRRVDEAVALPSGSRILVTGIPRGRPGLYQQFLVEPSTGEGIRLEGFISTFSDAGNRVVSVRPESLRSTRGELLVLDLESTPVRHRETAIFGSRFDTMVLSPRGERVAILAGQTLSVYDLASSKALFSARMPGPNPGRARIMFQSADKLRIVTLPAFRTGIPQAPAGIAIQPDSSGSLHILEADLVNKTLREKTSAAFAWDAVLVSSSERGDQLLVRGRAGEIARLALIDLATGNRVDFSPALHPRGLPALLSDGRVAVPEEDNGLTFLSIYRGDGTVEHRIPVGKIERVIVGWQPARDKLFLTVHDSGPQRDSAQRNALLLDLNRGAVIATKTGFRMTNTGYDRWIAGNLLKQPSVGSPASMTFFDEKNRVVLWNPITGQQKVLFAVK